MEDGLLWSFGTIDYNNVSPEARFEGFPPKMVLANRTMKASVNLNHLVVLKHVGPVVATPSLQLPTNTSVTTEQRPSFTWATVNGAKYYRFQLARDATFSDLVLSLNWHKTTTHQLVESAQVDIRVYDLQGRLVMSLSAQSLSAGTHSTVIDVAGLSTGVYLYRLTAGSNVAVGKMTLVK